MFVVWGTKHKIKNVGVVGDRCEACGELAAFTVTDHFEAGHIYYISLTQGTLRATSKTGEHDFETWNGETAKSSVELTKVTDSAGTSPKVT